MADLGVPCVVVDFQVCPPCRFWVAPQAAASAARRRVLGSSVQVAMQSLSGLVPVLSTERALREAACDASAAAKLDCQGQWKLEGKFRLAVKHRTRTQQLQSRFEFRVSATAAQ